MFQLLSEYTCQPILDSPPNKDGKMPMTPAEEIPVKFLVAGWCPFQHVGNRFIRAVSWTRGRTSRDKKGGLVVWWGGCAFFPLHSSSLFGWVPMWKNYVLS
ncbi:hypothetical protein SLE2022_191770 [Rubroshorea leprosula]